MSLVERLAIQSCPRRGVLGHFRRQPLDGDGPVEPGVPSFVDLAHPTGGDRPDDFVLFIAAVLPLSMIRDDGERTLLFDLDTAIQRVAGESPNSQASVQLTAVYHNLLRRWAEM